MTDGLVAWLRAQLDEDERVARGAYQPNWRWYVEDKVVVTMQDADGECDRFIPVGTRSDGAHMARHDPGRVLAEIGAKRKLIERYENAAAVTSGLAPPFTRGQDDGYRQACLDAIRDAAEVYADRPGYREEWSPAM